MVRHCRPVKIILLLRKIRKLLIFNAENITYIYISVSSYWRKSLFQWNVVSIYVTLISDNHVTLRWKILFLIPDFSYAEFFYNYNYNYRVTRVSSITPEFLFLQDIRNVRTQQGRERTFVKIKSSIWKNLTNISGTFLAATGRSNALRMLDFRFGISEHSSNGERTLVCGVLILKVYQSGRIANVRPLGLNLNIIDRLIVSDQSWSEVRNIINLMTKTELISRVYRFAWKKATNGLTTSNYLTGILSSGIHITSAYHSSCDWSGYVQTGTLSARNQWYLHFT